MSLENFKNIGGHIESDNPKEKQKILLEKIEQISLIYADKKFQEIKKDKTDYKFSEAVKEFTPLENIILKPTFNSEWLNAPEYKEKARLFMDDLYGEIDSIYETDNLDLAEILNLVDSKKDSILKYLGVECCVAFDANQDNRGAKILSFNKIVNIGADTNKKYKVLENLGFSKFDQFTEVHVDDFYNTGEKNLGPELIKNDLAIVAEYIVDEEPTTAAIVGQSWLLDTPLADRLGFNRINDDSVKQNDFSSWFQFINKDGQIDQKRFNEFLETGELPFKSIKAYIPVEDFLKKYLPVNRKGKINLKEINREREEFWSRMQQEAIILKTDWNSLLTDNSNPEVFIKGNKTLNELLGFIDSEYRAKYQNFLREMYYQKTPWSEFFKYKDEDIYLIDRKIDEAMKNSLYINKEVVIE